MNLVQNIHPCQRYKNKLDNNNTLFTKFNKYLTMITSDNYDNTQ